MTELERMEFIISSTIRDCEQKDCIRNCEFARQKDCKYARAARVLQTAGYGEVNALKTENESLVREADENAALAMLHKMRADDLEKENAELKVRLEKAVELPFVPCDHHIEMWAAQIKESCVDQCATIVIPCYLYIKCEDKNAAVERLNELRQYADN